MRESKKSHKILIIVIALILVIGILSIIFGRSIYNNYLKNDDEISFVYSDGVYEVNKDEDTSIFTSDYQDTIEEKIDELKDDGNYTIDNPLIIYNPYGTGSLSYYIYYTSDEDSQLSYRISTDGYDGFERNLIDDYSLEKEFQLIGFVPGEVNELTLRETNKDNEVLEKTYEIKTPKLNEDIDTQLEVTDGDAEAELSDGLYTVLGHDKNYASNIYVYDNSGVLREEFVLDGYRADRVIFDDGYMYYPYKKRGIVKVNNLGKIVKFYDLGNYAMHHDMVLDDDKLIILVNQDNTETIEDTVISLDLESGEVTQLFDMKDLLPEFYETAVNPGENSYGTDTLDWIHINALSIIGDDVVLSSRELSTIIYVSDFESDPEVKYLITDPSMVEGTSYASLLYEKKGDFVSQAGQHSITYHKDDSLDDGEYYLFMFNNNYGAATTRPDFEWSNYPGGGSYNEGETSYFYEYLVNENDKSYEFVKSFRVPYSSIVSSVELMDNDNIVVGSGKDNSFEEYDNDGNLIRRFDYSAKKYAYRVFKYSYDNLFANEK